MKRVGTIAASDTLAEAIAYMQGLGALGNVSLAKLGEGCHSNVYLYEGGLAAFPSELVVRIPKCPEAAHAIRANATQLKGTSAPQILHVATLAHSGNTISLEEYVKGTHEDLNKLTPLQINELAAGIANIHSHTSDRFSNTSGSAPTRTGTYGDYLQAMLAESVIDKLPTLGAGRYGEAEHLIVAGIHTLQGLLKTEQKLFSGSRFSLLHHDLNPDNMLWQADGRVRFIDWNATYGDPADDVDYVVTNNRVSKQFKDAFFEAYAKTTGRDDVIARVGGYTLKNQLDDLVWIIAMHQRFPDDPNYGPEEYDVRIAALDDTLAAAL